MEFFYRSVEGGRCEVVCTRCFLTVGSASHIDEIRRLEDLHLCPRQINAGQRALQKSQPSPIPDSNGQPASAHHVSSTQKILLVVVAALVLYVLPTAFEFAALPEWSPWVATVLPGDLLGCACLIFIFRRVKAGIALYIGLTAFEALIYLTGLAPAHFIPWFTDLVPTIVVMTMLLRRPRLVPLIPIP